jgi:hypothetical protein
MINMLMLCAVVGWLGSPFSEDRFSKDLCIIPLNGKIEAGERVSVCVIVPGSSAAHHTWEVLGLGSKVGGVLNDGGERFRIVSSDGGNPGMHRVLLLIRDDQENPSLAAVGEYEVLRYKKPFWGQAIGVILGACVALAVFIAQSFINAWTARRRRKRTIRTLVQLYVSRTIETMEFVEPIGAPPWLAATGSEDWMLTLSERSIASGLQQIQTIATEWNRLDKDGRRRAAASLIARLREAGNKI